MAEAGFYHQPNTTGDDRVMCFTCNVCLVCWEPADEPWLVAVHRVNYSLLAVYLKPLKYTQLELAYKSFHH
jgi:hypothetical protein